MTSAPSSAHPLDSKPCRQKCQGLMTSAPSSAHPLDSKPCRQKCQGLMTSAPSSAHPLDSKSCRPKCQGPMTGAPSSPHPLDSKVNLIQKRATNRPTSTLPDMPSGHSCTVIELSERCLQLSSRPRTERTSLLLCNQRR